MAFLLSDLIADSAARAPHALALKARQETRSYGELDAAVGAFASGMAALGVERLARVAVYLPKQTENVVALFGAARAGLVFVPINPILKPPQVQHILQDCDVRVLVTTQERLVSLRSTLPNCTGLRHIVLIDALTSDAVASPAESASYAAAVHIWSQLLDAAPRRVLHRVIDQDMAAILYTSGSTGKPKGVVLSHRNLLTGAHSVAHYLRNEPNDRLLAVLPLSFDYGLSQLTTAFAVGASTVLLDHLFARDVIASVAAERITGLAAVPPLWSQLADLPWPREAIQSLRYITNSGGAMPRAVLDKIRGALPATRVFLMYGLTEAFRATYLPPEELDRRPDSIGKAIPNAEVMVVRADGSPCDTDEPGELVQRGALVALGYWNAPEATRQRFRPTPAQRGELSAPEIAVWSGDTVRRDAEGFLYFIARRDEMIKTSGYRVSPTEIEEVILASGCAREAVAFGAPHPTLGQAIVVVLAPGKDSQTSDQTADQTIDIAREVCRKQLPAYMAPAHIECRAALPRNANGKYDRAMLSQEFHDRFFAHGS